MPVPRATAIVLCSCGARWGNIARASAHEDMEAVELALIEALVPLFARHWQLRHTLTLRDGAPIAYAAVIAKAAREMADGEAGPAVEEGRLALAPVKD